MTLPASWERRALDYFEKRAIDPELAAELGVREARGAIVFPVSRSDGSTFERRRSLNGGPAKVMQPKGQSLCPWWPAGRPDPAELVLVCEGESDGLAALSALPHTPLMLGLRDLPVLAIPGTGYPAALLARELAALGVRQVLLATDADVAGRAFAERASDELCSAGVQPAVVDLPDGRDLADVLATHESPAERGDWLANALVDAGCAAEPLAPPRQTARVDAKWDGRGTGSTLTDFTDIVAKPIEWLWRNRVALGKITALAGAPKIGKGLFYTDLIARVTRGDLDGDVIGAQNVILVTTEDEPGDTLKPRLMAAAADLARVSFFQMGTKDEPVPFRVPQDSDELSRRVAEKHAALVVIDPLMEFIDGKVDSHKSQPVRQAIATLNGIVREHGCALAVIFHLNKGVSTDALLRHEGSAAFTQVVRGDLMLGHDPEDPDGELGNQRVLAVSATNLAPLVRSLTYRIETRVVDGDTGTSIETARMIAIGESDASSKDLLRGRDDNARVERDQAVDFLSAELADGSRPAKEMKTAAREAGISDRTLARAKTQLGVKANRVGGTGASGHWEWSLRMPTPPGTLGVNHGGSLSANPALERDNGGCNPLRAPRHDGGTLSGPAAPERAAAQQLVVQNREVSRSAIPSEEAEAERVAAKLECWESTP